MNGNKFPAKKITIDLATYVTRKIGNGVVIKIVGVFPLKLRYEGNSRTIGTVNIAGKTLPVLSTQQSTGSSQKEVGKDSCILLIEAEKSFFDYKVGILVDSAGEIAKVAKDFI
ncbi:MAG: chemotaxis protein CheW [Phycisphaerae bacterium]|nr:chemotaxis protein CheW [Phycisphaerae bacterium]